MVEFEFTMELLETLSLPGLLIIGAFGVVACLYLVWLERNTEYEDQEQKTFQSPPKFRSEDPDVVIVGGGFTGSAFASVLGADGRRVVVIERDMSPPETMRGENLTPGGKVAFESLGLSHLLDTIPGSSCNGYIFNEVTTEGRTICPLPVHGFVTRHGYLVDALRKHANNIDGVTFIEAVAKDVIKENGRVVGVTYKVKNSEDTEVQSIRAPLTIICDGFYSGFRKQFTSLSKPVEPRVCIGLELRDVYCSKGPTWLQIWQGNPLASFLIYHMGNNAYRIAIGVDKKVPQNVQSFLRDELAPTMPDFVKKSVLQALEERQPIIIRVKRSFGSLDDIPSGVLLVGDVMNSRDPILAQGMTCALRDIAFWREALRDIDLADDEAMMKQRKIFKRERPSWAWAINTMSHVVNKFYLNTDVGTIRLRQQFFRGLKKIAEDGTKEEMEATMRLMTAVNTDPAAIRAVLESTRRDAIKHALKSHPWTSIFSALREAISIYIMFNKICGPALKERTY